VTDNIKRRVRQKKEVFMGRVLKKDSRGMDFRGRKEEERSERGRKGISQVK